MFFKNIYRKLLIISGYNLSLAEKEIEKNNSFSLSELRKWQEIKKWEIVNYHYRSNRFYRDHVGATLPELWSDLPIIKKRDLQQNNNRTISDSYQYKFVYSANTSGSSGIPLKFKKNKYCHARAWANNKLLYSLHGIDLGSREARFYGIPKNNLDFFKEVVKDLFFNRSRFVIFNMSPSKLNKFINRFKKNKFYYIYGYTNSIVIFSKYLIQKNIVLKDICPTIKKVIVTAEMCTMKERLIIEAGTGVPVINEYGASECSIIAFDCKEGKQHINEQNLFVENNEKGEILITDLFNKAMPFIRYKIGDLGSIESIKCACQLSNNRILTKLIGRENDIIYLPNGDISPGLSFYYVIREILEKLDEVIIQMQIRQTKINLIQLDIISEREINVTDKELIEGEIAKYFTRDLKVRINRVKSIPPHPSGKNIHFISELNC